MKSLRLLPSLALVLLLAGCAVSLRNPHIADLQHNPARYWDKTVSISGIVTSSWGLPLLPVKVYKVDDGTGEVTVVSQHNRTPTRGSRVRVRGRVSQVGVIGGRSLGLHINEDSLYVKGY
jgi:hypothetical protein